MNFAVCVRAFHAADTPLVDHDGDDDDDDDLRPRLVLRALELLYCIVSCIVEFHGPRARANANANARASASASGSADQTPLRPIQLVHESNQKTI